MVLKNGFCDKMSTEISQLVDLGRKLQDMVGRSFGTIPEEVDEPNTTIYKSDKIRSLVSSSNWSKKFRACWLESLLLNTRLKKIKIELINSLLRQVTRQLKW
uniref:Uncharacterized protein n=1 Tax=Acrobeloides nanus TaxID=290746 RepID=A0A914DZ31_9BILA